MTARRFDAYGTLLDVHAAMARQAPRLGQCWTALADEWRIKQLEYSWVGSLTGHGRVETLQVALRMR